MQIRVGILVFLLMLSSPNAQGRNEARDFVGGLDPDLWIVRSSPDARVVVFRGCSPEHCSTITYLQWISEGGSDAGERRELKTIPLEELNVVGAFVREVQWIRAADSEYFLISLGNTYTDDPTVKLRVTVGPVGKYRVDKEKGLGAAQPALEPDGREERARGLTAMR